MAITFEQDPNELPGMGFFIDDASGMRRYGYDPELADTVSRGFPLTADQSGAVSDMSQSAVPAEAPGAAVLQTGPQDPTKLPTLPGQAPAQNPISGLPSADQGAVSNWEQANTPTAQPIVRASGNPPPPPPAPAGTVLTKAEITPGTPGYTYDKAAEEARHEELLDRSLELDSRRDAETDVMWAQQIELNKQRQEDEKRLQEERQKSQRFEKELTDTVAQEINPDRIKDNRGLFGSVLGIVGEALAYLSTPDSGFGRMQAALDRRIQRDIEAQKEKKDSTINLLTKKLGSAQQAEAHYQSSVRGLALQTMEQQLKRLGVEGQYADQLQKMRDQVSAYDDAARQASYGKPGEAKYEFGQPKEVKGTGGGIKLTNDTTKRLEAIGLTPKALAEGMTKPSREGTNAPTIAQAVQNVRQLDNDIKFLEALAAENGGTIEGTGVLKIPEAYVGYAAKLGLEKGLKAEQAGQLLNKYINQQARSYGGAITESDRDAALKEAGESTKGKLFFLRNLRGQTNNQVRQSLGVHFPGAGNDVLDIVNSEYESNTGLPDLPAAPITAQNGPDKSKPVTQQVLGSAALGVSGAVKGIPKAAKQAAEAVANADPSAIENELGTDLAGAVGDALLYLHEGAGKITPEQKDKSKARLERVLQAMREKDAKEAAEHKKNRDEVNNKTRERSERMNSMRNSFGF
jgi:hypothetical protein